MKKKLIGLALITVLFFGCTSVGDFLNDANSVLDGDFSVLTESNSGESTTNTSASTTNSGFVTAQEPPAPEMARPVLVDSSGEAWDAYIKPWGEYAELWAEYKEAYYHYYNERRKNFGKEMRSILGNEISNEDFQKAYDEEFSKVRAKNDEANAKAFAIAHEYAAIQPIPLSSADSNDWIAFINSTNNEYNHFMGIYYVPSTVDRLIAYYNEVKDSPFKELGLTQEITANLFDGYKYEIEKFGGDTEKKAAAYKALYDVVDIFDIKNKEETTISLSYLMNSYIDERPLFQRVYELLNSNRKGELQTIANIPYLDHPENGLVVKFQGEDVGGILGGNPDFEYSFDYNGKKDVPVKKVQARITFLPSMVGDYEITTWRGTKVPSTDVVLIEGIQFGDEFLPLKYGDQKFVYFWDLTMPAELREKLNSFFRKPLSINNKDFSEYYIKSVEIIN